MHTFRRSLMSCRLAGMLFFASIALPLRADTTRLSVAPGVEFLQETISPPTGPLVINVLRIHLKQKGVRVEAGLGREVVLNDEPAKGREAVAPLAQRHGAIAAVNADFFPFTGDPLNLMIRDGELISESMPHRVVFGITAEGKVKMDTLLTAGTLTAPDGASVPLDGINRPTVKDEIVLLTPTYGTKIRALPSQTVLVLTGTSLPVRLGQSNGGIAGTASPGVSEAPLPVQSVVLVADGRGAEWLKAHTKEGDRLAFRFDAAPNVLTAGQTPAVLRGSLPGRAAAVRGQRERGTWDDVTQAVGGGPWLVKNGVTAVDGIEEGMNPTTFTNFRHPRTAVGLTAEGDLLLVAVDGRQAFSQGMTLPELGDYLRKIGAVQAINLDGGGSTSMVIGGVYVNGQSDGEPRPVANALLVFADTTQSRLQANLPEKMTTFEPLTVRAGQNFSLPATPTNGQKEALLWGSVEGTAFVSQVGVFFTTHAGSGTIVALNGTTPTRYPVTVLPDSPSKVRAAFGTVANNPPDRNTLTVVVTDRFNNPLAGQSVSFEVFGGVPDQKTATTNAQGRVTIEVVWDAAAPRRAIVHAGNLTPVEIRQK